MAQINPTLPSIGQPNATEDPDLLSCLTQILAEFNGNIDASNLKAAAGILGTQLASTAALDNLGTAIAEALGLNVGSTIRSDYAEVLTSQATGSAGPTDLATVGPTCAVTVPTNGFVAVYASAEINPTGGGENGTVYLVEATDIPAGVAILSSAVAGFNFRVTSPSGFGVAAIPQQGGFLIFPATAGLRTFKLQYGRVGGAVSSDFRNRKLWVQAFSRPVA